MQLIDRGRDQARARGAERMAQCNCTTVWIDARVVVLQTQITQHRQTLRGKCFIQFDHVDLVERHAGLHQYFAGGRCRTDTHDARWHAGCGHGDHARFRRQAVMKCTTLIGQQQRTCTVVDTRCIARRDGAVRPYDRFQFS